MNLIMMQNMSAIMRQEPAPPKLKRGVRLHDQSRAKSIILYLLANGKSSGSQIITALGIAASPKAYIQPHIKAGRVICQVVHQHKSLYHIAEGLTAADFGLKGD
jgi:hypothetical protein